MCLLKVERVDRNHNYFVRLFFDDKRDLFDRVMLALPVLSDFMQMLNEVRRGFARMRVGEIVSRDTSQLNEEAVARAGVESVLENGNDAVFGALFWFAVLGAPGALLYRLANTLDAMWGGGTPGRCAEFHSCPAHRHDLCAARQYATRAALLAATGGGMGQPERRAGDGERRGQPVRTTGWRRALPWRV